MSVYRFFALLVRPLIGSVFSANFAHGAGREVRTGGGPTPIRRGGGGDPHYRPNGGDGRKRKHHLRTMSSLVERHFGPVDQQEETE